MIETCSEGGEGVIAWHLRSKDGRRNALIVVGGWLLGRRVKGHTRHVY